MKIESIPFQITDWASVPSVQHPGETGMALWRTFEAGNVRVRMVEYSAGYLGDHWCQRGHVVLVLEGEVEWDLADGRHFVMKAGQSYQVADGASSHRPRSSNGARLFIVD